MPPGTTSGPVAQWPLAKLAPGSPPGPGCQGDVLEDVLVRDFA